MMSPVGLREIKKNKLRQAVQRETLRLIDEKGWAGTTVEKIAETVEISTTTFYRYYSSKEDVVLSGAYEAPGGGEPERLLFEERPDDEPVVESIRAVLVGTDTSVVQEDRVELLARLRLIYSVPELTAEYTRRQLSAADRLAALIARRAGRDAGEHEVRIAAAALQSAITESLRYWADSDGRGELKELVDAALRRVAPAVSL